MCYCWGWRVPIRLGKSRELPTWLLLSFNLNNSMFNVFFYTSPHLDYSLFAKQSLLSAFNWAFICISNTMNQQKNFYLGLIILTNSKFVSKLFIFGPVHSIRRPTWILMMEIPIFIYLLTRYQLNNSVWGGGASSF